MEKDMEAPHILYYTIILLPETRGALRPCNSKEASKLSKDDISRLETEALMDTIYGDRTAHVAKVTVVVMDVCTASRLQDRVNDDAVPN